MIVLSKEQVIFLHAQLIAETGGVAGGSGFEQLLKWTIGHQQ